MSGVTSKGRKPRRLLKVVFGSRGNQNEDDEMEAWVKKQLDPRFEFDDRIYRRINPAVDDRTVIMSFFERQEYEEE